MKIGIVGFSSADFNQEKAKEVIAEAFQAFKDTEKYLSTKIEIVSGLTNLGIPAIAYAEAKKHGFKTTGIACAKAKDYECFDCDFVKIVGDEWGDESPVFLDYCDVLYKFGGGKQSEAEFEAFTGDKEDVDIS